MKGKGEMRGNAEKKEGNREGKGEGEEGRGERREGKGWKEGSGELLLSFCAISLRIA